MTIKILLICDNFARGGLEKSLSSLFHNLVDASSTKPLDITLVTLSGSRQYIETSSFGLFRPHIVYIRYKYIGLAFFLLRRSHDFRKIICFRNHVFYILLSIVFCFRNRLWIRHSNTILSPLLAASYSAGKANSFPYLRFFRLSIRCLIYSLVPNHFTNSLENTFLVRAFTGRNAFCFVNPILIADLSGRILNNAADIKLFPEESITVCWAARFDPTKDYLTFLTFLQKLNKAILQSDLKDLRFSINIFTSSPGLLKEKLQHLSLKYSSNYSLSVLGWDAFSLNSNYDISVCTSFHEGLSNSFLELLSRSSGIVIPLTSSGFLEFASFHNSIYFYQPGDPASLYSSFMQLVYVLIDQKKPRSSHLLANMQYKMHNNQFFSAILSHD